MLIDSHVEKSVRDFFAIKYLNKIMHTTETLVNKVEHFKK